MSRNTWGFLVEFYSTRNEWWYVAIAGMKYLQKYMLRVTSGLSRTLKNLRRSYFWLGMVGDKRNFCQSCLACQRAKASNRAGIQIQESRDDGIGPGDLVAMDIATRPWVEEKYRYFQIYRAVPPSRLVSYIIITRIRILREFVPGTWRSKRLSNRSSS